MFLNVLTQLLAALVVFLVVRYLSFNITEKWGLPTWLDYKPFNCQICLNFWVLIAFAVFGVLVHIYISGITIAVLAVLNAIAMYIHQKNNTITVEEARRLGIIQ